MAGELKTFRVQSCDLDVMVQAPHETAAAHLAVCFGELGEGKQLGQLLMVKSPGRATLFYNTIALVEELGLLVPAQSFRNVDLSVVDARCEELAAAGYEQVQGMAPLAAHQFRRFKQGVYYGVRWEDGADELPAESSIQVPEPEVTQWPYPAAVRALHEAEEDRSEASDLLWEWAQRPGHEELRDRLVREGIRIAVEAAAAGEPIKRRFTNDAPRVDRYIPSTRLRAAAEHTIFDKYVGTIKLGDATKRDLTSEALRCDSQAVHLKAQAKFLRKVAERLRDDERVRDAYTVEELEKLERQKVGD